MDTAQEYREELTKLKNKENFLVSKLRNKIHKLIKLYPEVDIKIGDVEYNKRTMKNHCYTGEVYCQMLMLFEEHSKKLNPQLNIFN
jgi:uncharacterized protein YdcH (DUF465 family)